MDDHWYTTATLRLPSKSVSISTNYDGKSPGDTIGKPVKQVFGYTTWSPMGGETVFFSNTLDGRTDKYSAHFVNGKLNSMTRQLHDDPPGNAVTIIFGKNGDVSEPIKADSIELMMVKDANARFYFELGDYKYGRESRPVEFATAFPARLENYFTEPKGRSDYDRVEADFLVSEALDYPSLVRMYMQRGQGKFKATDILQLANPRHDRGNDLWDITGFANAKDDRVSVDLAYKPKGEPMPTVYQHQYYVVARDGDNTIEAVSLLNAPAGTITNRTYTAILENGELTRLMRFDVETGVYNVVRFDKGMNLNGTIDTLTKAEKRLFIEPTREALAQINRAD